LGVEKESWIWRLRLCAQRSQWSKPWWKTFLQNFIFKVVIVCVKDFVLIVILTRNITFFQRLNLTMTIICFKVLPISPNV
jgi:hypothetical protein